MKGSVSGSLSLCATELPAFHRGIGAVPVPVHVHAILSGWRKQTARGDTTKSSPDRPVFTSGGAAVGSWYWTTSSLGVPSPSRSPARVLGGEEHALVLDRLDVGSEGSQRREPGSRVGGISAPHLLGVVDDTDHLLRRSHLEPGDPEQGDRGRAERVEEPDLTGSGLQGRRRGCPRPRPSARRCRWAGGLRRRRARRGACRRPGRSC